jgi:hypothetical protein
MCTAENMVLAVAYRIGCTYVLESTSEYLFILSLKLSVLHNWIKILK